MTTTTQSYNKDTVAPLPVPDAVIPPTPQEIDWAIAAYETANKLAKVAQVEADEKKRTVINLVELYGFAASKAERSKRLEGLLNTVTVTRGTNIVVNEPAVQSFSMLLDKKLGFDAGKRFFSRVFSVRTKHELVAGAEDVVRTASLAQRTQQAVLAAFGMCFTISDKAPTIKIKLRTAEKPVRKPRAKKGGAQ